ncbi:MAG: flagellar hook-basal body complex protein FliE [Burkholderiaceae bacterium]|jgi:flagellar hook-basal body complex protein FliE
MSVLPTNLNSAGVANVMAQIRNYQANIQAKSITPPAMPAPMTPVQGKVFNLPTGPAMGEFNKPVGPVTPPVLEKLQTNDLQRAVDNPTFTELVGSSLQQVNSLQKLSQAQRAAYEKGEDIPLTDVVLGMQKSSLAFEATLQIRNKVLKAYEDILNMPV